MRYALRRLAASPGFTLIAVLSLALGIGANTAMFSIVNAVLLRPLPVSQPERLVDVFTSDRESGVQATSSYLDYLDIRDLPVFADAMAYELFIAPVEQDEQAPEMVIGEVVSANYFDVLGVRPYLGRSFVSGEEDVPGRSPAIVLGHGYWQRQFAGDPSVIGRTVRVAGSLFTVVGVAPRGFAGMLRGIEPDMWAPIAMSQQLKGDGERLQNRGSRSLFVRGRLNDGVTYAQADAAVRALGARLAGEYPTNREREMTTVPTNDVAILPMVDRVLTPVAALLLAMVGLVLLIACANLAGFLLARAADRRREVAVRLALGAGRGQLVRMLVTESLLLAVAGGAAGIAVAGAAVRVLTGFQPPLPVPIRLDIPIDTRVLLFTLGVSVLSGLLFGLLPALNATRPDVASTLRSESGSVSGARGILRHALVGGQVAVSMVLLVGAGLFVRSLVAAQDVDPGFDTSPAAILRVSPEMIGYDDDAERAFFDRVRQDLLALPGVTGVAFADRLPLGPELQTRGMTIDGVEPPPGEETFSIDIASVDAAYFDVLGVPLVQGRTFSPADGDGGPTTVAIVSEAFVRRFLPGQDPVGATLRLGTGDVPAVRIVGVARDAKTRTLGEAPRPYVYLPVRQSGIGALQIVARGTMAPTRLADEMRRVARAIEPRLPILEAKTMDQHLALMLFAPRMAALLLAVFGGLGLVLAIVGIWGIVSYAVARRTREVGLRMALGATPREAVALLTGAGARIVGIGAAVGLLLAIAAGRLLQRFLFGIGGFDPITFVSVPVLLGLVGVIAAWVPARRAASVDPMRALRVE